MYKYLIVCLALFSCANDKKNDAQTTKEKNISFEKISRWGLGENKGVKKRVSTQYKRLNADGVTINNSDHPYSQFIDSFDKLGYLVWRKGLGYFYKPNPEYSTTLRIDRTIDSTLTEIEYRDDTLSGKYVAIPTGAKTYTQHFYTASNGKFHLYSTGFMTVDDQERQSEGKIWDYSGNDTLVTNLIIEYPDEHFSIVKQIVDGKVVKADSTFKNIVLKKNTKGKAIVEQQLNKLEHTVDTSYHNISYEYY